MGHFLVKLLWPALWCSTDTLTGVSTFCFVHYFFISHCAYTITTRTAVSETATATSFVVVILAAAV